MKELTDLLDRIIHGDEKAYYEFRQKSVIPLLLGEWTFQRTLSYVFEKVEKEGVTLEKCYPEMLIDLRYYGALSEKNCFNSPLARTMMQQLKYAAEKGNRGAIAAVILIYHDHKNLGLFPKEEIERLIAQIKPLLTETNNKDAMYLAGLFYELIPLLDDKDSAANQNTNSFHAEDLKRAFECYQKAADLGHAAAVHMTGVICSERRTGNNLTSVEGDAKAIEYFEKAINMGFLSSIFYLGYMYYQGRSGKNLTQEQCDEIAESYLEKAASMDCVLAILALEELYYKSRSGKSLTPEIRMAKVQEYLEKTVRLGSMIGICKLLKSYNINSVDEDRYDAKALELLKKIPGLDSSQIDLIISLADLYFTGDIGHDLTAEQRDVRAEKYYKIAAEGNNPRAARNLGKLYLFSRAGKMLPDMTRLTLAKKYFEQARDIYLQNKELQKVAEINGFLAPLSQVIRIGPFQQPLPPILPRVNLVAAKPAPASPANSSSPLPSMPRPAISVRDLPPQPLPPMLHSPRKPAAANSAAANPANSSSPLPAIARLSSQNVGGTLPQQLSPPNPSAPKASPATMVVVRGPAGSLVYPASVLQRLSPVASRAFAAAFSVSNGLATLSNISSPRVANIPGNNVSVTNVPTPEVALSTNSGVASAANVQGAVPSNETHSSPASTAIRQPDVIINEGNSSPAILPMDIDVLARVSVAQAIKREFPEPTGSTSSAERSLGQENTPNDPPAKLRRPNR